MRSEEGKHGLWWEGNDETIDRAVAGDAGKQRDGATLGQALLAVRLLHMPDVSAQRVGARTAAYLSGRACGGRGLLQEGAEGEGDGRSRAMEGHRLIPRMVRQERANDPRGYSSRLEVSMPSLPPRRPR